MPRSGMPFQDDKNYYGKASLYKIYNIPHDTPSLFILLTPNHFFSQPVTLIILFSVIILTFPVWVWEICVFLKTSESQSKVKLLKTLLLVTPILLFGLIWDTFISLIPNLPIIYIASACFNLFIVIVGYSLSHHLVSAYETLENLFPAMKEIVAEKVKLQPNWKLSYRKK